MKWKDNLEAWERTYQNQNTKTVAELNLSKIQGTEIIIKDQPEELKNLQNKIDQFWEEYSKTKTNEFNGRLYGALEWKKDNQENKLVVQAYETEYVAVILKLEGREKLTEEENEFLNTHLTILGASGYVKDDQGQYLLGKVAQKNIKQDLWETVPQGVISNIEYKSCQDPFLETLSTECSEEIRLDLNKDFTDIQLTHLNAGIGNFTLIYQLLLKEESKEKIKCSSEHLELKWANQNEILDPKKRYSFNPVTIRLFEKLQEK